MTERVGTIRRLALLCGFVVPVLTACQPSAQQEVALSCMQPDSLRRAPLLFSDAIYGQRGTNGGTVLEVSGDSAGWSALLEPVHSAFESDDRRWPEVPESLSISWSDRERTRGRLLPKSGAFSPDNRLSIDSAHVMLACDTTRIARWFGKMSMDTIALERRRERGYP